ncbi:DNA breaking-rejoining enzyme [Moniliophthora roreri MCA 2997]|uniref:DNA breaking-rejoining enzyme n=2 Tax=Moniliophthora roreri TaxID=221103 RepID=V2WTJ3_MONRO|nr:DNA breaking-rejoining enzyme [Moniliophthora roreri MCA 2997]
MYDYNWQPQYFKIQPVTAKKYGVPNDSSNWSIPRLCQLMHLVYCISFVCLLHINEALKITFDMVKFPEEHDGKLMELTLPFQKTNQYGDIKPFPIREFSGDMMYLCPVHTYLEWIHVSQITSGYVCHKINSADQVSSDDDNIMVSAKLNNIQTLPSLI